MVAVSRKSVVIREHRTQVGNWLKQSLQLCKVSHGLRGKKDETLLTRLLISSLGYSKDQQYLPRDPYLFLAKMSVQSVRNGSPIGETVAAQCHRSKRTAWILTFAVIFSPCTAIATFLPLVNDSFREG